MSYRNVVSKFEYRTMWYSYKNIKINESLLIIGIVLYICILLLDLTTK